MPVHDCQGIHVQWGQRLADVRTREDNPEQAKRRLPSDELAENIVAEAILEHLELCGWRLERKVRPGAMATR